MSDQEAPEIKWIEGNLIPNILKHFGKSNDGARWKISLPKNNFYLSYVCFLDLTFEPSKLNGEKASRETLQLVVKKPPIGSIDAGPMSMSQQFHNEILFYTKVAPGSSRFPRCFYTTERPLEETALVIENIAPLGYSTCPVAFDVPLDYVVAAVEEMGRFHAMNYVKKERDPEEFNRVVKDIQESRFNGNSWMSAFLNAVATRPIEWLRNNHCEPEFCDKLEKHLGNAYTEIMMECVKPVEPLATLCHGDFTSNNVFFRMKDGKLEAMLFDFAVMLYASPAIDIATFLYLNCSTADRTENFDLIYGAYHKALTQDLRDAGVTDLDKYSYDKFVADYKRRASFGFMIAIFFLPFVRNLIVCDFEIFRKDPECEVHQVRTAGGEAMTEEYGKMILELKNAGCLDHLLN